MANLTDLTTLPGLEAIRRLASSYPNPTNAQAVAALDSFSQPDAASLIGGGLREDVAASFLLPDGVFPRMRLLAWGWTKKGDRFRSPQDASWWKARYQYPLWQPIETYIDQLTRSGVDAPSVMWDEALAAGSPEELSYSVSAVVQQDLPPVNEAPCPKWLIPPGRGMLPIPNPSCLEKPVRDEVEKVFPRPVEGSDWSWLLWLAVGYLALRDKR